MNSKYELIIFDCDGTLVDSESISIRVIQEMFYDLGIMHSYTEIHDLFVGTQMKKIINYATSFLNKELPFDFEQEYRQISNRLFRSELKVFEGVFSLLGKLDMSFCIASNGPREKMDVTLDATGLSQYFAREEIFTAYDFNKWKPDPTMFLAIIEQYRIDKTKVLVIEDSYSGVKAAINAGVDVFAFCPNETDPSIINENVPTFKSMKLIENKIFALSN